MEAGILIWLFCSLIFWLWGVKVLTWTSLLVFDHKFEVPLQFLKKSSYYHNSLLLIVIILLALPFLFEELSGWLVAITFFEMIALFFKSRKSALKIHRDIVSVYLEGETDPEIRKIWEEDLVMNDMDLWKKLDSQAKLFGRI